MGTQGGFGLDCKITVGTVLTTIAHILDGEFPKFKKFLKEFPGHDADEGWAEYIATGKRSLEPFKLTLGWDSADSTHAAIVAAFDADTTVNMSIEDPDGVEVIAFAAHVETLGRISVQEDGYKCEVEVQPTGKPEIT